MGTFVKGDIIYDKITTIHEDLVTSKIAIGKLKIEVIEDILKKLTNYINS